MQKMAESMGGGGMPGMPPGAAEQMKNMRPEDFARASEEMKNMTPDQLKNQARKATTTHTCPPVRSPAPNHTIHTFNNQPFSSPASSLTTITYQKPPRSQ